MIRNALAAALATALLATACRSTPPSTSGIEVAAPGEPGVAAAAAHDAMRARQAEIRQLQRSQAASRRVAPGSAMDSFAPPAPPPPPVAYAPHPSSPPPAVTDRYERPGDNPVQRTAEQPVSTFSIDVDTGSYSNVRGFLRRGMRPPADAVRAEEFINYFAYGHPAPGSRETPFRVTHQQVPAPWDARRHLLMVGIKGYDVPKDVLPPANLVFLVDTSGSMDSDDKLPLLKRALSGLAGQLRPQDRVSIVAYAGTAGLVLPPTPGDRKDEILAALDRLQAHGSTNGGDGIRLAYAMARRAFVEGGVNRVILATDGDFNVGTVDGGSLETMVADQRRSGIALTTLGFGTGNYNDHLAERLADAGDGNHAYVDTLQEARKVLVEEMSSTLLTIARDVKIQIEFNPATVAEYRLVGYENRMLAREDFANDRVDAGDIGAGHEVTALYELTLVGSGAERLPPLRYGTAAAPSAGGAAANELAHLRLRYKRPDEADSRLVETPILRSAIGTTPSASLRFAASVAAFADALRGGTHLGDWDWSDIAATARASRGEDRWGLRAEFVDLVERARRLVAGTAADEPPVAIAR
jgi:Ca-activated chloride channel family protein